MQLIKQFLHQQKSSQNPESYRNIPQLCETYQGFQTQERTPAGRKSLDQPLINKSTDQWWDRLKAVVPVNGGHIEQLF